MFHLTTLQTKASGKTIYAANLVIRCIPLKIQESHKPVLRTNCVRMVWYHWGRIKRISDFIVH